jgi:hypothetical protein
MIGFVSTVEKKLSYIEESRENPYDTSYSRGPWNSASPTGHLLLYSQERIPLREGLCVPTP